MLGRIGVQVILQTYDGSVIGLIREQRSNIADTSWYVIDITSHSLYVERAIVGGMDVQMKPHARRKNERFLFLWAVVAIWCYVLFGVIPFFCNDP